MMWPSCSGPTHKLCIRIINTTSCVKTERSTPARIERILLRTNAALYEKEEEEDDSPCRCNISAISYVTPETFDVVFLLLLSWHFPSHTYVHTNKKL